MKRLFPVIMTMLLGASLAFGQTGGDKATTPNKQLNPQPLPPGRHPETTKTKSGKKGHKGGKKSKKGSSTNTGTTTPK